MQTRTRFTLLPLLSNFSRVLIFSCLKFQKKNLSLTPGLLFPLVCARNHLTLQTAAGGKVDDFLLTLLILSIYFNCSNPSHNCLKFCCFFEIEETKTLINRKLLIIEFSHCLNNWPLILVAKSDAQ